MGTVPDDERVMASELSYVMLRLMLYLWGAVSRSALYENSMSTVSSLLSLLIKTVLPSLKELYWLNPLKLSPSYSELIPYH